MRFRFSTSWRGPQRKRPEWVVGPLGQRLTLALLPSKNLRHWLPMRKAEVVAAVKGGLLTLDEALQRYNMTLEEFANWERAIDRFGLNGLRTTRTAHYRALQERQQKF
ncbi:MAG: DUF1153 domain-containing protein [Sphingomonadales bacterium]|nr:DUF1153 domain-containing protein [Sphingomonadales bacterium]